MAAVYYLHFLGGRLVEQLEYPSATDGCGRVSTILEVVTNHEGSISSTLLRHTMFGQGDFGFWKDLRNMGVEAMVVWTKG